MRLAVAFSLGLLLLGNQAWSAPTSDDVAAARQYYKRAMAHYDLGKYDQAIAEFQQAYEIKDDPVLLFNIAQAHRLAKHYAEALTLYKSYLRRSPKAANRLEVEQRIGELEETVARQNQIAQPVLLPVPPPPVVASPPPVVTPHPNATSPAPVPVVTAPVAPIVPPPVAPVARVYPTEEVKKPLPAPSPVAARVVQPSPPSEPAQAAPAEPAAADANNQPPAENEPAGQWDSNLREGLLSPDEAAHDLAERQGQGKVIGGAVMIVLGLGMVAGGISCGVLASNMSNKQQNSTVFLPDTESTGKILTTLGIVLDAVGGALAVSGLAVAIIGTKQKKALAPRIAFVPMLGPGLAGADLHLQF